MRGINDSRDEAAELKAAVAGVIRSEASETKTKTKSPQLLVGFYVYSAELAYRNSIRTRTT